MNTLPDIEFSEELIRRFDKLGPRYTSYPTADRFNADFTEGHYISYLAQRNNAANTNPPLSIYVHLPFCESLCYFCGCNKIVTKDRTRTAEYLRYLAKEMALVAKHIGPDRRAAQLHLGGGTPTFLTPDELRELMTLLRMTHCMQTLSPRLLPSSKLRLTNWLVAMMSVAISSTC